jgi:hypothetical protein
MSDDKTNRGRQDDLRVDINDKNEVEYLHGQFPQKSHEEIVDAVRRYGPMREDIVKELRDR